MLKVGDKAPDFELPDKNQKKHSLSDFAGRNLVLYFYPKDNTPGCTKEACNFNNSLDIFKSLKTNVVGISADSIASHESFSNKYKLNFLILSDTDRKTVQDYGVYQPKKFMGKDYLGVVRTTFLIDKKGIIRKVYDKVNPISHSEEVIKDLEKIG